MLMGHSREFPKTRGSLTLVAPEGDHADITQMLLNTRGVLNRLGSSKHDNDGPTRKSRPDSEIVPV